MNTSNIFRITEQIDLENPLGVGIRMELVSLFPDRFGNIDFDYAKSRLLVSHHIVSQAEIDNGHFDVLEMKRQRMRLDLVAKFFGEI